MCKKISKNCFGFILSGAAVIIFFLLISAPPATLAADPLAPSAADLEKLATDPPALTFSKSFKILGKGRDFIVVLEQNFIITEETKIWDINGIKIGLNILTIPCRAEIKYQIGSGQNPICLEIKIKEHL